MKVIRYKVKDIWIINDNIIRHIWMNDIVNRGIYMFRYTEMKQQLLTQSIIKWLSNKS
jgi:hypothetical protein